MFTLICAQCVYRCQNRAVVSLRSFKRRDARFEVFQRGHRTIVWAGPTSRQRQSTASG
jgi:hypothetical protein